MFEKIKSKSVLLSWGLSYLLFILISVIIILALYLGTVRTLKEEITTSNDLLLNNIQNQIDSVIKGSKLLSDEIGLNQSISRLQYMNGHYNTINPYSIYEAHYALKSYYKANPSITNIYVYYKKNGIVLSNNSTNSLKGFYNIYFSNTGISYEDWEAIFMNKYDAPEFIMVPSNNNFIFGLTSYPYMSNNDNYMTVIIEFNKDKLFVKLDESAKLNSSSFFMLSDHNQVVPLSHNNELLNKIDYNDLPLESDYTERKIGKENYIFSYIPSDTVAWKYVVAMPEKIFWQNSINLFRFTLLGIFAAILIGGIAMRYSLRYNYNPINDLLKSLEKKYGYHFTKDLNEYYFIKHSFDNVATEQEKTKALLESQNRALSSAILSRLIKGNSTQFSNAQDLLYHSKLNINFDNYGIILFYIESFEDIDSSLSTQKNLKILEEYNISQFILDNVANEVISRNMNYISTQVDNIMVYVVNMDQASINELPGNLIAIADEIKAFIDKNYDFEITTAVTKPYHDLAMISDCFYEALEIMEYKHILGSDSNAVYTDVQDIMDNTQFHYPQQKEHLLVQEIKRYDVDKVKDIIEDLFKQNINATTSILDVHFCVMLSIISTLVKTVTTMKNINAIEILGHLELTKRIQKCNTSSKIKSETLYIAEHIINCLKASDHTTVIDQDDDLIKTIVDFVENNYTLMDLSVAYIADALGVNAVTMSKLFRNTLSESLPDYINRCRIEHAKEIMKNGYSNLEELSVQVGYNNTKTLTRAFKKYVGVPPGKYKDMLD